MTRDEIHGFLETLGVPRENRGDMAVQIEKRARQMALEKSRSYADCLKHVIQMLAEGWAGRQRFPEKEAPPAGTDSSPSIRPWKIVSSRPLNDYRIFKTHTNRVVSPRTKAEHDVFVIEGPDWVNVLALPPERQVVLAQQYRHGSRQVMREIPGGIIDAGEKPAEAGARELLEETGYQGSHAMLLGKVLPNPAFQTNCCHTVLILDARHVREPRMEGMEDIAVKLVPEEEFAGMVADGRIPHALVAVAELWRRLWRSGQIQPTVV